MLDDLPAKKPNRNLADQIELVCLIEATARKPGNVHPVARFEDLCYNDFVRAAASIAAPLAAAADVGLGRAIFEAVQATRTATGTNVNLGIVLLLAPLAAVSRDVPLKAGLAELLNRTTIADAEQSYAAIRLANPGGMGHAPAQDISDQPTINLRQAMALAADRDRIAEQYVSDFDLVLQASQKLVEFGFTPDDWESPIVRLQIWMLSQWPDTLMARKCGWATAEQASFQAAALMQTAEANGSFNQRQLGDFDRWLRADGHRRNPGTTADLIAAALFAAWRAGSIKLPARDEVLQYAAAIHRGYSLEWWQDSENP